MNSGPYIRQISRRQWWLGASRYRRYMLRELTSLLIGAYAITLLVGLWRFSQGAEAFSGWLAVVQTPTGVIFSTMMLIAAVYHSITWFNVTPKAMSVRIGSRKLPDAVIIGAHYVAWLVASLLLFLLLRL